SGTERSSSSLWKRPCAFGRVNAAKTRYEEPRVLKGRPQMKPTDVTAFAKEQNCKFVDFKFIDLPGTWQHTTIPATRLSEELFEEGIGFDGSSVRGWQPINASDMQMTPDASTAKIDPFHAQKTLSMICHII